jgi:hypothetical protein
MNNHLVSSWHGECSSLGRKEKKGGSKNGKDAKRIKSWVDGWVNHFGGLSGIRQGN